MKFAFFDYIHNLGGAQIANIRLIENMQRGTNHEFKVIDVFGTCKNFNDFVFQKKISHHSLINEEIVSISSRKNLMSVLLLHISILRQTIKYFRSNEQDIIWTSSEKGLYTLWLAKILSSSKYKIIFYAHGYDRLFKWKRLFYLLCRYQVFSVWTLSESFRNLFISCKVPEQKLFIIPNVIDIDSVAKTIPNLQGENQIFDAGYTTLLVPASVIRDKGIMEAVAAMSILLRNGRKVQLYIAGAILDADFYQQVNSFILSHQLADHIFFLGWRKDIGNLMSHASIILLPSYSEGMPLVILEAMALRKPVISTAVGAIPEMIFNNYNGYLIQVKDEYSIAEAVERIIDNNEAETLGNNGYMHLLANYTLQVQQEKFVTAISEYSR